MADILREVFGLFNKRYRDMGDGTHAEVVAIGGEVTLDMPETPLDVIGPLTNTELRATAVAVTVGGIAVPSTPPRVGQKAIAVTGTAVQLSAASVPLPGGTVMITAHVATTYVTAGGSGVNNTATGAGNGRCIKAAEQVVLFASDLNAVYINGTAGDWVSWSAG